MKPAFVRPLPLAAALLINLFTLQAQEIKPSTNYVLNVDAERPDALYKQGETVSFHVTLRLDKQPVNGGEIAWSTSKDGVAPKASGKVKLENGRATITGKLDEPGFLTCFVTYQTNKLSFKATAGAAIDALRIKPSLPVPDDFDAFWKAKKADLAKVPMDPKLTAVKSGADNIEAYDLQAASLGAPVSGYFARPSGAKPKSLPAILTVHGAGVRSSSLGSAVGWAKQGLIALDINAHGIPNGKPDQFYTDLANGELKDYRAKGRDSRDTIYFLGMCLRLVRAIDFLTSQPEWDGQTVVVYGSSQGGLQAIAAAGLDSRVTFIAAGVPAGCDHSGHAVNRISGWPKIVPNDKAGKPEAKVTEAARYIDCMNFATRTKAGSIFTVGFIDGVCPPTSVYAAYNNFSGPKQIYNDIKAGHTNTPKATESMRKAVLKHLADQKK
ncbi:MAG TPA: acetylxylan esterase [Verrucomicrobiae bacterium]